MKKKTKKAVGYDDYLLNTLQKQYGISDKILFEARIEAQRRKTIGVIDVLLENGVINIDKLTVAKAHYFGSAVADMNNIFSYGKLKNLFPVELAKMFRMIPTQIVVAVCDPGDLNTMDNVGHYFQLRFGIGLRVEVASEDAINKVIQGAHSKDKRIHTPKPTF